MPRTTRGSAEGLSLHQTEKRPDDVPKGLGIAPDAIDFKRRIVTERKGGAGAKEAVSRQAPVLRGVHDRSNGGTLDR